MRELTVTFWDDGPRMAGEYLELVREDSPVAGSEHGRNCEAQLLVELICDLIGKPRNEVAASRRDCRRNILAQWTNDDGPFSENEILELRRLAKPWKAAPPEGWRD
ncbi:MAG: hypothetical protein OXP74_08065 [Acidobacteriota bacterium]|nr:hypothetical protein [Acidobacteriota bacterium]